MWKTFLICKPLPPYEKANPSSVKQTCWSTNCGIWGDNAQWRKVKQILPMWQRSLSVKPKCWSIHWGMDDYWRLLNGSGSPCATVIATVIVQLQDQRDELIQLKGRWLLLCLCFFVSWFSRSSAFLQCVTQGWWDLRFWAAFSSNRVSILRFGSLYWIHSTCYEAT